MTIRYMQHFFEPRSIAVIGASERSDSLGGVVLQNLLSAKFPGSLVAVSLKGDKQVFGVPCIAQIDALEEAPDLAIVCTSVSRIPAIVDDLGRKGVHAVLIIMGGFSRTTPTTGSATGFIAETLRNLLGHELAGGQTLLESTWEAARPYDMRIMGPNCIGTIMPRNHLNASYAHCMIADGDIAFVGQSGALALAIMDWAKGRDIGFSCVTSLGDSLDIDIADVIEYLADDFHTKAILLQVDHIRFGSRFVSALRAATRNKPVIVMKSNRVTSSLSPTDQHADAFVEVDRVYDAVFKRVGVMRVGRIELMTGALETLTRVRQLHGSRLALISNGPGPAMMAVDRLLLEGGELAQVSNETVQALKECQLPVASIGNPVDLSVAASPQHFADALEILLRDKAVDAILVIHTPTLAAFSLHTSEAIAMIAQNALKPVLTSFMGHHSALPARQLMDASDLSTYGTPEGAVDAFLHLVNYRRNQDLLDQFPRPVTAEQNSKMNAGRIWALVGRAQTEKRAKLDRNVTMEILSAAGIEKARQAFSSAAPGLNSLQIEMGIARNSVFGPLIYFGKSRNQYTATLDRQFGLPPLSLNLAMMLTDSTLAGLSLADPDNDLPDCREELAGMLVLLSQLAITVPVIKELRIDPLVITHEGIMGFDASTSLGESCESAIIPYPAELEETITLPKSGRRVTLRPIRGEDAPAHVAFGNRLSPETIRYRFFGPRSGFTQHELAQFTQIDYAREMAFIATSVNSAGEAETLGVVRTWTDPDNVSAEFAVIVEDSMRGEGLGASLTQKIINYTKGRGTLEIRGTVLSENQPMRQLAKKLGFGSYYNPEEQVRVLHLRLNEPADNWQRERLSQTSGKGP